MKSSLRVSGLSALTWHLFVQPEIALSYSRVLTWLPLYVFDATDRSSRLLLQEAAQSFASQRESDVAEIVLDYYFMRAENETMPHVLVKDRKTMTHTSPTFDNKTSNYAVALLAGTVKELEPTMRAQKRY